MTIATHLKRAARLAAWLVAAMVVGVVVAVGSALIGHEILVLIYGEDLSVIDDTPPMVAAVALAYLAGIASGLIVLVAGWRRSARASRGGASR